MRWKMEAIIIGVSITALLITYMLYKIHGNLATATKIVLTWTLIAFLFSSFTGISFPVTIIIVELIVGIYSLVGLIRRKTKEAPAEFIETLDKNLKPINNIFEKSPKHKEKEGHVYHRGKEEDEWIN